MRSRNAFKQVSQNSRRANVDTTKIWMRTAANRSTHLKLRPTTLRVFVAASLIAMLAGCMGYVPGRQSYWDSRVKGFCELDGGVTVYETVTLTREEHRRVSDILALRLTKRNDADSDKKPYVIEVVSTKINASNPEVARAETLIRRRSDGKVLGQAVQYWRRGGDIPTGITEASSFICPEQINLGNEVFKIEGGK